MEGGDLKFLLPSSAKSMIDDGGGREGPRGGDVGLHLVSRRSPPPLHPPRLSPAGDRLAEVETPTGMLHQAEDDGRAATPMPWSTSRLVSSSQSPSGYCTRQYGSQ